MALVGAGASCWRLPRWRRVRRVARGAWSGTPERAGSCVLALRGRGVGSVGGAAGAGDARSGWEVVEGEGGESLRGGGERTTSCCCYCCGSNGWGGSGRGARQSSDGLWAQP